MPNHQSTIDSFFTALADPTRRAVVERLSQGPATVRDLAEPFPMALPSFMQHLSVLEKSGLITSEKTGRVRTCQLAPDAFAPIGNWLNDRRAQWKTVSMRWNSTLRKHS